MGTTSCGCVSCIWIAGGSLSILSVGWSDEPCGPSTEVVRVGELIRCTFSCVGSRSMLMRFLFILLDESICSVLSVGLCS